MDRSEIDVYMDIARNLGVEEKDLIWHGECSRLYLSCSASQYDVIIHDGYNRYGSADWSIKSYPRYAEVALKLKEKGFSVCSVGLNGEYIENTEDKTGLDLFSTIGIINNSKIFLGNDSGFYHIANALNIKNVVIFTATSIAKNYDPRFHKFSTIIGRDDLDCRPCQAGRGWKTCNHWNCRDIDPEFIVNKVEQLL